MKRLIYLAMMAALLVGCTETISTKNPEPVFTYGQVVKVQTGFYRNIDAELYVTGFTYCRDNNNKLTICYNLNINYGIFGQVPLDRTVLEADLVPVIKEETTEK